MVVHEKKWLVLQVQVDHLNSEDLGAAIGELYEAGASNVQVISTVTKKNRPGFIFVIDTNPAKQNAVEEIIVRELGVSGWQVIPTVHRYLNVDYSSREVEFIAGERSFRLLCETKVTYGDSVTVRPEDRTISALKVQAQCCGVTLSRSECREILMEIYKNESTGYVLGQGKELLHVVS